jgi:hypothetical protein
LNAAVVLLVPAILWVVPICGGIAAAWICVAPNTSYCLIGVPLMYQRIFCLEKWACYRNHVLIPTTIAASIAWLCRWVMPVNLGKVGGLGVLIASSGCVLIVAAATAPLVRPKLTTLVAAMTESIFSRGANYAK